MHSGQIGPNAITRVAEAIDSAMGPSATQAIFQQAGLGRYLGQMPTQMVDEADVARLQLQLRSSLGPERAAQIALDAGRRTGDYLLAYRIPRSAQRLLRLMPAGAAARLLVKAIARHAWTFSGSGEFSFQPGRPFVLTIRRSPLCSLIRSEVPVCHYYSATFERVFQAIVHQQAKVIETECESAGAPVCRFELSWPY